nr:MAG TPA: hypothetical protein [Caudoviricetes sp.]
MKKRLGDSQPFLIRYFLNKVLFYIWKKSLMCFKI